MKIAIHPGDGGKFYGYKLYKFNNPVLIETSFRFNTELVEKCPGYWSKTRDKHGIGVTWNEGRITPGKAIIEDFIKKVLNET